MCATLVTIVALLAAEAWLWAALLWTWTAWVARSWRAPDIVPADTDVLYPDEQEWVRAAGRVAFGGAVVMLVVCVIAVFV